MTAPLRKGPPRRAVFIVMLAAIALVLGLYLVLAGLEDAPDVTAPHEQAVPAPSEAAQALKPPIQGLVDNREIPPTSHFDAVQARVVGVTWAELQPEQGGPIVEGNAIDEALEEVRSLNERNPGLDMKIKLRVYAGIDAPAWSKRLSGSPISVTNPQNGDSGTVGRFWEEEFGRAYDELQAKLAARYDHVPEIREVVITRCTTVFAEPFIRNTGDASSVEALLDAGFTVEADQRCHHEQIDAHTVWQQTRSALSFNPYQIVSSSTLDGGRDADEDFTTAMMEYCRSTLGERCILQNNSLRWPPLEGYEGMYENMRALGPPVAFQTATQDKIGDLERALNWAIRQHANSVEIFVGYENYPVDVLAAFDRKLKANNLTANR